MAFRTNKTPVLQTKSASGSVATFNTALAMPLSSCNIAVNAWQEGSGDPSPSNVRPIHGFSEVNATVGSGNFFDGTFDDYKELSLKAGKQVILQGDMSNDVYLVLRVYDENKARLQAATTILGTGTRYGVMTLNSDISYYTVERSSQSGTYNNIMLSFGNTVKPYTPYVTPTIYTKQLGEDVYGGSYNSVTGERPLTHLLIDLSTRVWRKHSTRGRFYFQFTEADNIKTPAGNTLPAEITCTQYKTVAQNELANNCISLSSDRYLGIIDESLADLSAAEFQAAMNGVKLLYKLINPIESNIGATPISTNIGNNTIFADTGDIDLTYKDLDIAKRGNFREVFKLPS